MWLVGWDEIKVPYDRGKANYKNENLVRVGKNKPNFQKYKP